jgi:hypothetical protein
MGKAGKFVLAGPFDAPDDDASACSGLFVRDVKSDDEARAPRERAGDPSRPPRA